MFKLLIILGLLALSISTASYNRFSKSIQNTIEKNDQTITISNIKRSVFIQGGNIDDTDGHDDSKVKHAADASTFDNILKESDGKLIVVDFSASWCMPCKMIAPMFDAMANSDEYRDVVFVKIDVDENPEISEKYQIMSMPTFLFIRDNEVVDRFSGASVEKLKETIDLLQK